MRQLLADLRALGAATAGELTSAQQQELHQRVSENAATAMAVCQNGLAALGHLLAHSAPVIEDGTVGADSVEALGWLMAEVGGGLGCHLCRIVSRRSSNDLVFLRQLRL